ncbi:MAG TPA: hypothetical protein VEQ63_03715, partial [Bryobacteraceae bacterium]|nr:hypothetical protein [Bryobacteraceae bacterium]
AKWTPSSNDMAFGLRTDSDLGTDLALTRAVTGPLFCLLMQTHTIPYIEEMLTRPMLIQHVERMLIQRIFSPIADYTFHTGLRQKVLGSHPATEIRSLNRNSLVLRLPSLVVV